VALACTGIGRVKRAAWDPAGYITTEQPAQRAPSTWRPWWKPDGEGSFGLFAGHDDWDVMRDAMGSAAHVYEPF